MNIYETFAGILEYPEGPLESAIEECVRLLGGEHAGAANLLRRFEAELAGFDLGRLQETYAGSFDLVPDCSLNLGYHLFGDDWRRSIFLANLIDRYRECGFYPERELPDHLCVMLRFLARREPVTGKDPLIDECLVPALNHILQTIDRRKNPYEAAIEALLLWLPGGGRSPAPAGQPAAVATEGMVGMGDGRNPDRNGRGTA